MTFRSLLIWLLIWCSVLSPVQAANLLKMGQIQAWGENHRCHYPINASDPSGLAPEDYWVGMSRQDRRDVANANARAGGAAAKGAAALALLWAIKNPHAVANWFLSNPVGNSSFAAGTVYAFASGDPSSPINQVGSLGATMTRAEVDAAKRAVGAWGERNGLRITMAIGEALPEGKLAAYQAISQTQGKLVLGGNPTWYEFFHEFGHALQHRDVGYNAFRAMVEDGTVEHGVHDFMMGVFGSIMTEAEKAHARGQLP
ncbi:MAG: hypothetical protein U0931_29050 [Vulcanimicrobiota bacterium]